MNGRISIGHKMNISSVLICVLMAFGIFLKGSLSNYESSDQYFKNSYNQVLEKGSNLNKSQILPKIEANFNDRLDDYKENISNLSYIMTMLAAFLIAGIIMLFYRPKEFQIPFLNLTMPDNLLYPSIIVGIVVVWLQFGFTLNEAIDSRLALHSMIEHMEALGGFDFKYNFSNTHLLVDNGIIDSWGDHYYNLFKESDNPKVHSIMASVVLYGIFAPFWALAHACSLALTSYLLERKNGGSLTIFLYIFVFILFILSGVAFVSEFEHGYKLSAWMWLLAAAALTLWSTIGIKKAKEIEKRNANI